MSALLVVLFCYFMAFGFALGWLWRDGQDEDEP